MKVKRAVSSYVLLIGVLALLATGSLLIYSVYSAITKSTIANIQRVDIKPLPGTLNQGVLSDLMGRRQFSPEELAGVQSLDYSDKNGNWQQATISAYPPSPDESSNEATDSGNISGTNNPN